jgi:hypothetical protein
MKAISSPREYMACFAEEIPAWLREYVPNGKVELDEFLASRLVYYPGSGHDGHPLIVFGASHSAHSFIYVDYGVHRDAVINSLRGRGRNTGYASGVRGYELIGVHDLAAQDLLPRGYVPCESLRSLSLRERAGAHLFVSTDPYATLCVLSRMRGLCAQHGPERLAILFLGADGFISYDAIFCQPGRPAPFAALIQDHGFGGNWDRFGRGGLLERIAIQSDAFPAWVLCEAGDTIWTGYDPVLLSAPSRGGMHGTERYLWRLSPNASRPHPR